MLSLLAAPRAPGEPVWNLDSSRLFVATYPLETGKTRS
jgi:hypothetical protein